MKKTGGALLSMLNLERQSSTPLTRQLENSIRKAVLDGTLSQTTRLPSTRQLALDLGVSRLTVKTAFEQLKSEGYIEARHGSGTYVAQLSLGDLPVRRRPERGRKRRQIPGAVTPHVEDIRKSLSSTKLSYVGAFRPGIPALDLFPRRAWAEVQARAIRNQDNFLLGYGPSSGLEELKQEIADHVRDSRGIECATDQIVITAGAQQAFSIILLSLISQNESIWVEDPGHIAFIDAARLRGHQVDPVPLDAEGFSLDYALEHYDPSKLIFVTPSHQHPLGITMSLPRRLNLLEAAHANDSWVIEDDYDSEFHFEERPQPALKALDRRNRVIYVGSFSKSMFPGLRLGYLIGPSNLAPAFASAETIYNQNVSPVQQKAMAYFMADGSYNAHLRRMRSAYKTRRDLLSSALADHAEHLLTSEPSRVGMHLVTRFKDVTVKDTQIAQQLWDADIGCLPLGLFRNKAPIAPGLLLGFACAPEKQIIPKVQQMVQVIERYVS